MLYNQLIDWWMRGLPALVPNNVYAYLLVFKKFGKINVTTTLGFSIKYALNIPPNNNTVLSVVSSENALKLIYSLYFNTLQVVQVLHVCRNTF